jgi:hypothetical protein
MESSFCVFGKFPIETENLRYLGGVPFVKKDQRVFMRTIRIFLGIFALLSGLTLLASGPLLNLGWLHPLAHQRVAYIGTPIIVIYVVWTLVRERRQ